MDADMRGSTLKEYCIRDRHEKLLQQWHYAMNGSLTPDAVTADSPQTVWWIDCLGHEWAQEIRSRTTFSSSCPVCAGKVHVTRPAPPNGGGR